MLTSTIQTTETGPAFDDAYRGGGGTAVRPEDVAIVDGLALVDVPAVAAGFGGKRSTSSRDTC